jgi:hypothetical protein
MKQIIFSSSIFNYLNVLITVFGYFYFKIFKYTPALFYQSYVRSYSFTNAKIRDFLCKFEKELGKNNRVKNSKHFEKIIKKNFNTDDETEAALSNLKNEGYYVFKDRLDEKIISELLNFTKDKKCIVFDDKGKKFFRKYDEKETKISSKYDYNEQDLIENSAIQKLITREIFLNIAERYFETKPCLSAVCMWWSPVIERKISIEFEKSNRSAQMFHFDLDRIKWLKLFIYLTDADEEGGAHEYVATSHQVNNKPKELRDLGYERIPDELIKKHYTHSLIKKVCGKKGTIFIADTSCYHRGSPPKNNDRLMLVVEFSTSLFGAEYAKLKLPKNLESFFQSNLLFKEKTFKI